MLILSLLLSWGGSCASFGLLRAETSDSTAQVSHYSQIRPIFQVHCHGCHQPAKARGSFVMIDQASKKSLELFQGPIGASHCNCRALLPHQRQVSDEQIRLLVERETVIGVVFDA